MIVRFCIAIACGFVAALALTNCAHTAPGPSGAITDDGMPARLYCVTNDGAGTCVIYRSAQPTPGEFSAMVVKLGLRSVIKLNSAIEGRDQVPGGVELMEHPWSPVGPIDHDDTTAAMYDLEHAPRPTLLHCSHGVDRTGYLVAIWRVKHEHVMASSVWAEWRAFPREVTDRWIYDSFERETGYHIPDDER